MDNFEKQLLINLVKMVLDLYSLEVKHKFEDEDVNKAFGIFSLIKKYEITKGEEKYAREDLNKLFGIDSKKLTKNVMYNMHCSKLVNAITGMIKNGELK